jgi:hypothetical protein
LFRDFNRDPAPAKGGEPFSLDRLDADVRTYLGRSGALIESPIARLSKTNPLSIELASHDQAARLAKRAHASGEANCG